MLYQRDLGFFYSTDVQGRPSSLGGLCLHVGPFLHQVADGLQVPFFGGTVQAGVTELVPGLTILFLLCK